MKKSLTSSWIFFVSLRYLFTKRKEKGHVASFLAVAGIALGVSTLIIVLSVMNGFQHNYIDNINEVMSYHMRIDQEGHELNPALIESIQSLRGIKSVVPFVDFQTTLKGEYSEPAIALIRGIPPHVRESDNLLARHLSLELGQFNLEERGTIVLGAELALAQGIFPGDQVTLMSLSGDTLSRLTLKEQVFTVTGTVRTGYLEYDKSLGFISLDSAREIMGEHYIQYGIKINQIGKEDHFFNPLTALLSDQEGVKLTTWRDYNKAFFEALRMEKVLMFLVVSLVFLVVAVNIYQSLKRSVSERMEEIALLKSIGAVPAQIKMIFLHEGLLLSLSGVFAGMVLGIVLSLNINTLFHLLELAGNAFLGLFQGSGFSIYSSRTFYLVSVPVLIMVSDLIFIGITAVILSLTGAWAAASPVAGINPAEVLNIE